MNTFRSILSAVRHARAQRLTLPRSDASIRARYRFSHSMLGEPGLDEAVRIYGIGR